MGISLLLFFDLLRLIAAQEGGHLEHLSGSLAVTACEKRGMHVEEVVGLEEKVGCHGGSISDTHHGLHHPSAGSEMEDGSQVFVGVFLLGHGVFSGVEVCSLNHNFVGFSVGNLHFDGLSLGRTLDQSTGNSERSGGSALIDLLEVGHTFLDDDLETLDVGSIAELDENDFLVVLAIFADSACPSNDSVKLIIVRFGVA